MKSLKDQESLEYRLSIPEEHRGLKPLKHYVAPSLLQRITDIYFKPKSFEKSGKMYESLGVKQFQKLLIGTVGKWLGSKGARNYGSNYFIGKDRSVESLKKFEGWTRYNESVHALFSSLFLCKSTAEFVSENYGLAATDAFFFLINAYPTMLQRYNRTRIYTVLEKKKEKEYW